MSESEKKTIMQVLNEAARLYGDKPAYRVKLDDGWRATSWAEYREQIRMTARGFMAMGLRPGQSVSILGYNRPEWFLSAMGAIFAGARPTGIYLTSSAEHCRYIIEHSDSHIAVIEDESHLAKLVDILEPSDADGSEGRSNRLRAVVLMAGPNQGRSCTGDRSVIGWEELMARGKEVSELDLEARMRAQQPDDPCTLVYTPGTTGDPKAVMLSHDNLTWTVGRFVDIYKDACRQHPGERPFELQVISYLPLCNIAEQFVSLHGPMHMGGCAWFAQSNAQMAENLREVRPTLFLGVPRVWEKIQARVLAEIAKRIPTERRLVAWARKQGLAGSYAEQFGQRRPALCAVADKLVFRGIRRRLGLDRCVMHITAAAPVAKQTLDFYLSFGITIHDTYGMSETTGPATAAHPGKYRTGKLGHCLPGAEMRIAPDGEICMRGRHVFKGYYKNAGATAETVDADGWLHSGDIGAIDADGFLRITDRKKDLIITAGGENVAPQVVEAELNAIPMVSRAVVIGDRRRYLTALVTLDAAALPEAAREAGSDVTDLKAAAKSIRIRTYLDRQIKAVNRRLDRVQSIKKFVILPGAFSEAGGELSPSLNLRRKVINQKYADEIEALYG